MGSDELREAPVFTDLARKTTVTALVSDAPSVARSYGSLVIMPTFIAVTYRPSWNNPKVCDIDAAVSGPRVLKGGGSGATHDVNFYDDEDLPGWVRQFIVDNMPKDFR